jgi:Fe-S oxidoreductase
MELYPVHEGLARAGSTAEEYQRITTPVTRDGAGTVFFPGCNIYKQPDKLLSALDIIDAIGDPYHFLPGLEYCCGGSARGTTGDAEWAQDAAEKLFGMAEKAGARRIVFWCPTCMCILGARIRKFMEPACECLTFPQFVRENIAKLDFPAAGKHTVTFHEPCKTSYMGIDLDGVRDVLRAIPGTEVVEMRHYGRDAMCCGCRAVVTSPGVGDAVTLARLDEAEATSADTLVDLCHNCHWIFMPAYDGHPEKGYFFTIDNFATYVAAAMGRPRADTLKGS